MAARKHNIPATQTQLEFAGFLDEGPRVFKRNCPSCGGEVRHTDRGNRNQAVRLKEICRACDYARRVGAYTGEANPFYGRKHTEETLAEMRARKHPHTQTKQFKEGAAARMRGSQNKMRGSSVYELWVKKFGIEKANKLMAIRRERTSRASSGENNPMFGKPSPCGSGNGWSGWYKGWFFRSLRELAYMINVIEAQGLEWKTAESNALRIPYTDWKGVARTYRADFLIGGKVLVEIKPLKLHTSKGVMLKRDAALEFCKTRGMEYCLVDHPRLSHTEIVALHDSGAIKFTDRYEAKYTERFHK